MNQQGGYLFVTFAGESSEGECIYFSLSRDGMHWNDLNAGKWVLRSEIGTKGVRDPFLLRGAKENRFYLIATDLRIASGISWPDAVRNGSKNVVIWESSDLVQWKGPRLYSPGPSHAGCIWAPEAVYDRTRDSYMMFWSAFVEGHHRIYCAWTRDFREFSEAKCYLSSARDLIDMTILESRGIYYRFYKDEVKKTICADRGTCLEGAFTPIPSESLMRLVGVEGPAAFLLPDNSCCLLLDHFATGTGYQPLISRNPDSGIFKAVAAGSYHMGETHKRHGSVMRVTEQEFQTLSETFGRKTDE